MNEETTEQLQQLRTVSTWKRGSERAPHKPLLLLLTLASVQRGENRLTDYETLHPRLTDLLRGFGPPRQTIHPEYPFWRLQNDGDFWEIPEREQAIEARGERIRTGDVPHSLLRETQSRGGFAADVYNALRANPAAVNEIAVSILEEHFPSSLHESLLDAVGMPWIAGSKRASNRDPEFRNDIVRLYEHRCAMCGFDGRLGITDIALEAAHIKWHAFGGPDRPANGILLCSIHHQAFDRGAVGLTADHRIEVSQDLHGGTQVENLILGLCGETVRPPIDPAASPAMEYIEWHRKEVFRGPARRMAV